MSEDPRDYDRMEKQDEKQYEKAEKHEKSWDEKWERDPVSAAVWAVILIWAGVALLVENLGLLTRFGSPRAWTLILVGAGAILILESVYRLLVPAHRRPVGGSLVVGAILLGIGLGQWLETNLVWAVVLIGVGVVALLRGIVGWD
ncbi:MAG: hypothetical protein GX620_15200 [Chloroflexi bacterium]|nr:hypothetical protein [Chloroflexota bacterium]